MDMNLKDAMIQRHSVRHYQDISISENDVTALQELINRYNAEADLHMQLVLNEPKAFGSKLVHYGMFSAAKNYIALVGRKDPTLEERCGYYGEKIVLHAQLLGLNTCWVAGTFKKIKDAFEVNEDEMLVMVIAIGYGINNGNNHKVKTEEEMIFDSTDRPQWFIQGVKAAALAPSALNQHKYRFQYKDGKVYIKTGFGACMRTDIGIAKLHFELGSGKDKTIWG